MRIRKAPTKHSNHQLRMFRRYDLVDSLRERSMRGDYDHKVDEFIITPEDVTRVRLFLDLPLYHVGNCLAITAKAVSQFEKGIDILPHQRIRIENWAREMKETHKL